MNKSIFFISLILIVSVIIINKLQVREYSIEGIWESNWSSDVEKGQSLLMFDTDGTFVNFYKNTINYDEIDFDITNDFQQGSYKTLKNNNIVISNYKNETIICNILKTEKISCDKWPESLFIKKNTINKIGEIKRKKLETLSNTDKIYIIDQNNEKSERKKTITDSKEINKLINIITRSELLEDSELKSIPQNYALNFMDENGNLIASIGVWASRQIIIGDGINHELYMIIDEDSILTRLLLIQD